MIQDISPYRLDTAYRGTAPAPDDCFFSFRGEDVLLRDMGDGHRSLPSFRDLGHPAGKMESRAVFLFRAGREPVYLLGQEVSGCRGLGYFPICELKDVLPEWVFFAGATALHLSRWYEGNRYCGRCGGRVERKPGQRALACPECGNTVYPGIAPVVMVAVTDGDRLLMTKYADRSLPQWVLISGFVEAGETLEEAAEREVYEETGIRIRDLQYFGSQPWGFSGSVIAGYTARLDGPDGIRLDRKELAEAEWHPRTRLPDELTDISIAYEMIEALRL